MTKRSRDRRKEMRFYIKTNVVANKINKLTQEIKQLPPAPSIPELFSLLKHKYENI